MKHPGTLLLAAAAPLLVSVSAHAASIDTFTITPVSGGTAITFQLPSTPSVTVDGNGDFQIYGVTTSLGLENTLFFSTGDSGGFGLETPQDVSIVNGYGPQLFTGTNSVPTFTLGTFTLLNPTTSAAIDTVTIAPLATTTVTPEPSSLILLGTGALGLFGAARRRFAL